MLGAIIGDIVGSRFEFNNNRSKDFELFAKGCIATDDSIMTLAIAKAIMTSSNDYEQLGLNAVKFMQEIGRKYPDCGFGGYFNQWVFSENPKPYNSFGNGAAMRVSSCGFIAESEDEAKLLSLKVTEVTHNHYEGITGAEAAAIAIFMAKNGATINEIRERIEQDYYSLDFTLDSIRDTYQFNETCQETVPQAIVAFLESTSFEDAIRNAISIGGDSDTIAAITGAIAEAYYGVPLALKHKALTYLDDELLGIYHEWEQLYKKKNPIRKFKLITKYIGKLGNSYNKKSFYQEFYAFVRSATEYELQNYQEILEKHGLEWEDESMKSANVDILDEQAVLALILGVFRANRLDNDVLDTFIREGHISRWLRRLKVIDGESKVGEQYTSETSGREIKKPLLKQVKISFKPVDNKGGTSELIVTKKQVIIKSELSEGGTATHQYELGDVFGLGEAALSIMSECLNAEGWNEVHLLRGIDPKTNLYKLKAEYEDGKVVVRSGVFDRTHVPEKEFTTFITTIRIIMQSFGFGGIVELSGFMSAMKKDEVKYCGVEFSEGGKLCYYHITDLQIDVGDMVILSVGDNDYAKVGKVKTVEFYPSWNDVPYLPNRANEKLRKADENELVVKTMLDMLSGETLGSNGKLYN